MADVKISQLPAATTPLDGTELAPIVQSGTTKRVTVANLTVGRALTASSLTLSTPLSAANGGTGLTSLGTGVATFLGTPTSANLAAAVTDETGTGALVFASSPTIATPTLSTSFTSPLHIGGTTASSTLTLQSTSGVGTSDSILFKVGNNGATTAATISTTGVLGIGVTPSPWLFCKAIDISTIGSVFADGTDYTYEAGVAANAYRAALGGWFYKTTQQASYYVQELGAHKWYTAASGSANASISWTQAMTLDTSGNLLVGTTSAGTLLTVNGVATLCSGTATPAGGSTSARLLFGTTAGFGIYYGSGAPTVSAAQGSIYLRSDGSSTSTRMYVNTNGSTTWTNVTTAA